MTNLERIQKMVNESPLELAYEIASKVRCEMCPIANQCKNSTDKWGGCIKLIREWLDEEEVI